MPSMVDCVCRWCKTIFQARTADVKRGWGKYCSKHCKAMEQEKRTGQHRGFLRRNDDDNIGHPFESGYFGHGQE
jgi:hypothetical protein